MSCRGCIVATLPVPCRAGGTPAARRRRQWHRRSSRSEVRLGEQDGWCAGCPPGQQAGVAEPCIAPDETRCAVAGAGCRCRSGCVRGPATLRLRNSKPTDWCGCSSPVELPPSNRTTQRRPPRAGAGARPPTTGDADHDRARFGGERSGSAGKPVGQPRRRATRSRRAVHRFLGLLRRRCRGNARLQDPQPFSVRPSARPIQMKKRLHPVNAA